MPSIIHGLIEGNRVSVDPLPFSDGTPTARPFTRITVHIEGLPDEYHRVRMVNPRQHVAKDTYDAVTIWSHDINEIRLLATGLARKHHLDIEDTGELL